MSSASPTTANRSTLRRLGPHFVIAPPGAEQHGLAAALAPLPPLPGALVVLAAAADAAPVLRAGLAELARAAAERGADTLVVAASGLAAPGPRGRRPAEQLAALPELTGLTVIASDAGVTVEPDGRLSAGEPGTGQGSWWRCHPAGAAERLGPHWPVAPAPAPVPIPAPMTAHGPAPTPVTTHVPPPAPAPAPAPMTAHVPAPAPMPVTTHVPPPAPAPAPAPMTAHVPAPTAPTEPTGPTSPAEPTGPTGPTNVTVTPLAAGYWVTATPPAHPLPVLNTAVTAPHSLLLVLGQPEHPALPTARQLTDLAVGLLAAPSAQPRPRGLLLSAPWAAPAQLIELATVLCASLDREVRLAIGLPRRTPGGDASVLLDADAAPTWEPCLTELAASPASRTVTPSAWRARPGAWAPVAPAVYQAFPGWQLEAVPAGLWLRPDTVPVRPLGAARLREPDPAQPVLIVGHPEYMVPQEVWDHLGELLGALPPLGAAAPGLLVDGPMDTESEAVARFSARLYKLRWLERTAGVSHVTPPPVVPPQPAPPAIPPAPERAPEPAPELDPAPTLNLAPITAPTPAPTPVPSPPPPAPAPAPEPARTPAPAPTPDSARTPVPAPTPVPKPTPTPDPAPDPTPTTDREAVQRLLGPAYHRWASRAEQLATRLPSLRTTTTATAQPPATTDLVAVLLHHLDGPTPGTRTALAAAAHSADPADPLLPVLRCLGAGLRRLPSHHGAVLVATPVAPAGPVDLAAYTPGAVLTEPAPITGLTSPDTALLPDAELEFAIWSSTARRTSACGEPGDEPVVVFAPGTSFTVLAVDPPEAPRPARVLLQEAGTAKPATDRLRAWLQKRDAIPPADRRPLPDPEHHRPTQAIGIPAARY
ncbi:hypothetical protein P3T35_005843 [Kitasatospora sp. GP30]|uniref:hypothetical protein n=1 Tax=Kitasatospora sp. GP30 TaxID=3035084 RepID=UPI000C710A1F|nr:hypothetical protein [Kitasatospora sp. GP30]MDH6143808.1 hypothetical protein [Kitasatospora sp. GP30]